ncbi:hypothetical protein E2562_031742 [Oryza meyeriana var. granulata]|uniref:Uncharacterized protein n=1 Tax=Oryza meyeriana var. granulata TaxID=110450 RepID=A0A6G1CX10_9ORYZ|nr:hypothetical protein E2562_031742 [Oryza meyeriana var. granulata]
MGVLAAGSEGQQAVAAWWMVVVGYHLGGRRPGNGCVGGRWRGPEVGGEMVASRGGGVRKGP